MTPEHGREPGAAQRDGGAAGADDVPAPAWFALLVALAVVAHVVGNPPTGSVALRVGAAALGASALVLVWRPASRVAWAAVASLVLVTAWLEAPVLGNHWLLGATFAAAVLVAVLRARPWSWTATTVRLVFVTFYAFAAFAKLNTAFLDPAVSCAVFYANQGLASWGLPTMTDGAAAVLPIAVAVVVELSVPVLLLVHRTRALGVAVVAAFHYVISLDVGQHFYDFTAVIFVGLAAFAHADVTGPVGAWFHRRRSTAVVLTAVCALLLAVVVLPLGTAMVVVARAGFLLLWIPLGGAVVWLAVRGVGRPASVPLRPTGVAAAGSDLGRPTPELVRRLLPLRSADRSTPARCQALWLPAL